jgi:hypothetical protein
LTPLSLYYARFSKQAKHKGKNLFVTTGRGLFKPTVVGEVFSKATYGVGKGTKVPPAEK